MIAIAFFSCQKEEDIATPTSIERLKVPSISEAKSHFELNNKIPIRDGNNNGIEFRTSAATITIKWDESSTKKYKDETDTSPQQVDILYTPITLNTQGNAKMFLASIDDNGTVDSKYVFIIYTIPENPRLFSGYVFIYDLDGNQESMIKYEEGIKVSTGSYNRMAQRNDGDGGGGFTMGELLNFIGGDWFGLDGYIENYLVEVYWPEFTDVDDFGGGPIDDSPWFNPINIPVATNAGGSGNSNGNTGNGYDPDDIVWWQPIAIFAHGLSISNAIEVDLSSIEANWLMNTATQDQLDGIANYINGLEQTEEDGYNQGDIDYTVARINFLINNSNATLTTHPNVSNDITNAIQFDSFGKFQNFIDDFKNAEADTETEIDIDDPRKKITDFSFPLDYLSNVEIRVNQTIDTDAGTYNVTSITSELTGVTFAASWEQTDWIHNVLPPLVDFDLYGHATIYVFIKGVGEIYSENFHYNFQVDKITGEALSGGGIVED